MKEFGKTLPKKDIALCLIIILVGFSSFGLGRLSVGGEQKEAVVVRNTESSNSAAVAASVSSGEVVASKNGTKYHFPWCSGALTIKPENLVHFKSAEEARVSGYTPASNCKGLE